MLAKAWKKIGLIILIIACLWSIIFKLVNKISFEGAINSAKAQIEILKPLADKYNEEQYNKALNEAKENYKEKFKKANALEVFEEESTQELIEKSINSDETISKEAKYSLNSLIVDNIKPLIAFFNKFLFFIIVILLYINFFY